MEILLGLREETKCGILDTAIVKETLAGTLSSSQYARYLINVWHYAIHSSRVIGLAGSRAVNSHPELAQYLFHHANEELGHDAWAMQDLNNLGWSDENIKASRATAHCTAMIGYEYFMAGQTNPVSIFGWLYILEAMGDDLGKSMAENIANNPSLKKSLKFVAGHGEADVEHTADLTKMIQKHVKGQDMTDVIHAAEVVKMLYVGMFKEV